MPRARRQISAVIATLPVFKRLVVLWLILMAISGAVFSWHSLWGISLLWGFSVCLLPAIVFARFAGQVRGARDISQSVHRFYSAESAKLILTAALFAVVFTRDVPISMPVFLCAFVTAQIAQLIVIAASVRQRNTQSKTG
ncbi:ATP synthase subunit I [Gilvimarinus japonicus]|jgi:ATP synthase protein I|uniref:ATP synthase subunit I n=1 Tax=Gilvimarinus japonicus TaxID=1796469 RepID=A0ABV7HS58_9GAMM